MALFFNNVGKVLTETGQGAMQKTKDMAETVKLNNAIAEEERKIATLVQEVGAQIAANYEKFEKEYLIGYVNAKYRRMSDPQQEDPDAGQTGEKILRAAVLKNEDYLIKIAEIKVCQENIFNYQEKIKGLRGFTKCPQCGSDVALGAAFCSNCGARMEEGVMPQNDYTPTRLCPGCGAQVKEGVSFCTQCGTKLS